MKTNTKVIYIESGTDISIQQLNLDQVKENLVPAIYVVSFDKMQGKYFLRYFGSSFKMPSKIYGDVSERTSRILKSYKNRNSSTGVLLYGLKGSGKTLLMKNIANAMLKEGLPIIIVDSPYSDTNFLNFMSLIENCVIIFDEFAKVYGSDTGDERDASQPSQQNLLPLFDGAFSGKRLILVSENNKWSINPYFLNRPGRILYRYHYQKLPKEVVYEFCKDNQLPDDQIQKISNNYEFISDCSFDIISTIINEYKIHGGDILEIIKTLNIDFNDKVVVNYHIVEIAFKKTNNRYSIKEGVVVFSEKDWGEYQKLLFDFSNFAENTKVIEDILKIEGIVGKFTRLEFYKLLSDKQGLKINTPKKLVGLVHKNYEDDYYDDDDVNEEHPDSIENVTKKIKTRSRKNQIEYIQSKYSGFSLKGYFGDFKVSENLSENLELYDIGGILLKIKKVSQKTVLDSYDSYWN